MKNETGSARPRRLFPVLLAVTRSYDIVFGRLSTYVRVAAAWAIAGFVAVLALWLWQPAHSVPPDQRTIAAVLTSLTVFGLLGIASAGVTNAWHRAVLLERTPARLGFELSGLGSYAARGTLLGGIFVLALAVMMLMEIVFTASLPIEIGALLVGLVLLGCALAVGRATLALPAASIGDHRVTFLTSWALTRGGSWRLLAGGLLVSVPPFVAYQLLLSVISDSGMTHGFPLAPLRAGALVGGWTMVVSFGATYLSLAYRFFVEGRDRLDDGTVDTLKEHFR